MATTKLNIGIGVAFAIAVIAAVTLLLLPPTSVEAPAAADPETSTDTNPPTTTEDESEPATNTENTDETAVPVTHNDIIRVDTPLPEATISSPLTVSGEARGTWFFEGDFPVILTDWNGLIIAEGYATADGQWMTEEYVPFSATLTFTPDTNVSDRGSLILQKSNPSGLPENDDALEYTVYFD